MSALTEATVAAVVDEDALKCLGQRLGARGEIHVVPRCLTRQDDVRSVVEVVVPLAVKTMAPPLQRAKVTRGVVLVGLGEDVRSPPETPGLGVCHFGDLRQEMPGAPVEDLVRSVEPKAVKPVGADPLPNVVEHQRTDRLAVTVVNVQRLAPVCLDFIGQVVAEKRKDVSLGAEVIVDHVEEDGQSLAVALFDQPFQAVRSAVTVLGGEWVHTVVAPALRPRELPHRHQLERRDAQRAQGIDPGQDRVEGPRTGERADVQFVEDKVGAVDPGPAVLVPGEVLWEEDGRGGPDSIGLPA